jgi:predicted Zn-dependent protease
MMKLRLFLLSFCVSFSLLGQTQSEIDAALAAEYFSQGKIEESISLYKGLLKQGFNQQYYASLLQILYSQEQNKDAENLIKRAIKQNPDNNIYSIDLGEHYLKTSELKQAKKIFDRVIDNLKANNTDISRTASNFLSRNNLDYAAFTYQKARQVLRNQNLYSYELAYIYQRQGKDDLIAREYLALVENNPAMLSQIKIYLGSLMTQSSDDNLLRLVREATLAKVQKTPNNTSLTSLLIWLMLQEKDYKSALSYSKALDRRQKESNGEAVYEVAQISLNNEDWETAIDGYKYLTDKGKETPYYTQSLFGMLTARFQLFISSSVHTEKAKQEIENQYLKALNDEGKNASSASIMLQLANLFAYHLSKPQEAVDILTELASIQRLSPQVKAEAQLAMADVLLMNDDVWGASLEYSKVALDLKNDEIGSKAKFAKAKLSYYIGEFENAEIQFDALRSSTSKFIANDAMEYSLLISDNMDEDSTWNGLTLYARADLALYQNDIKRAKAYLDTLNAAYLYHNLFDEVLFKRATIAIREGKYQEADSLLQTIVLKYPYDLMADDALYLSAQINETFLQNPQRAKENYERIILDYPSSLYVTQSRKRYTKM